MTSAELCESVLIALGNSSVVMSSAEIMAVVYPVGWGARSKVWAALKKLESQGKIKLSGRQIDSSKGCKTPQNYWTLV